MSPRKTRRGGKAEGNYEKSLDSESIKILNTTDEGQRALRKRRQTKQKNTSDSDADVSVQLNESKLVRMTRGRKAVEYDNEWMNITGPTSRKRTKKDKEATIFVQDSGTSDQSQIVEVLSATKSKNLSRRRGGRKKDANKSDGDNEHENDNESMKSMTINDGVSSEDNEVAAASKRSVQKTANTPTNVRFIQLRSRNVASPIPVTPECSPITMTLTPHRTTKTPRKSPINIGSPKTHSKTSQRVSKTPRKLPVVADSPVPSEQSSVNGTPRKKRGNQEISVKLNNSPKTTVSALRKSSRSSSTSPGVISTKARRSLETNSKTLEKSHFRLPAKSPNKKKADVTPKMHTSVRSPQLVLERISSPKVAESAETPVLTPNTQKRVSEEGGMSFKRQRSTAKKNSPITNSGTPLRSVPTTQLQSQQSAGKRATKISTPLPSALKKGGDLVSSTPRERIRRSLNLSPGLSPKFGNSPFSVESFYGGSPKISSTRIQQENSNVRSEDVTSPLISDDESFDISGVKAVDNSKREEILQTIEITDDNSDEKDDTYELAEPRTPGLRGQKGNDTYELEEPKTPALRKKKNLLSADSNSKHEDEEVTVKRVCRVRFASPPMSSPKEKSKPRASRSATPASKLMRKKPGFITKRSPTKADRPTVVVKKGSPKRTSPRRRSNSLSLHSSRTNVGESKRRSMSVDVSRRSIHKTMQESINRLSKPRISLHSDKKPEIKPMSAKKVPNFAQIHQKKFAKMESVVDAKKRVEERHIALRYNATPTLSAKVEVESNKTSKEIAKKSILTAKDTINGVYNNFGFKVRKAEATRMVNKQLPSKKSENTKTEKRMALKGVRSNRRFEVLMQMRNIKH